MGTRWVLTAAHCVERQGRPIDSSELYLSVGGTRREDGKLAEPCVYCICGFHPPTVAFNRYKGGCGVNDGAS